MSNYPTQFDDDTNLYLVHDSLRVHLVEDYNPGDTSITVDKNPIELNFPSSGIITLTEQCSEINSRAISLSYSSLTTTGFEGLEIRDNFTDAAKPKKLTIVTLNVIAEHHNELKDALIAIEEFAGAKGEISSTPLQGSMEARINFLRSKVLPPKAWFSANTRVGAAPLVVTFTDLSLRAPNEFEWDFGDSTSETLTFTYIDGQAEGTSEIAPTPGTVTKTYTTPGLYDVSLTVTNPYGTNTVVFEDYISVRTASPDEATIIFTPSSLQSLSGGVLRSRVGIPVDVAIDDSGEQAGDPIVSYNWEMSDDLTHPSFPSTTALYSIGGLYDVILRTNSTLGSYRISTFPETVDIIERSNLWLSLFNASTPYPMMTRTVNTYEFGLISETFKSKTLNGLSVTRDSSFLDGEPSEDQQKREFYRNVGFAPRTLVGSGDSGTALIYWASGAATQVASQTVNFSEFNGFDDTYTTPSIDGGSGLTRSWNWTSLNSTQDIYFLFGTQSGTPTAATNADMQTLDLSDLTITTTTLTVDDFSNGADELLDNVGDGSDGEFSVYRSCWRDSTGYIVRNDGAGTFFRIKSFYKTEGVLSSPVQTFLKLDDIPGSTKYEGQLVALTGGIYFFNNTGEVAVYDPTGEVWATGGPGIGSSAFSAMQDTTVSGYDDPTNTLLATSDGDRTAYLSFDYTNKSFIKFNEVDLTFSRLPDRPEGDQFAMTVF